MWTHEWTGDLSCALGSIASGAASALFAAVTPDARALALGVAGVAGSVLIQALRVFRDNERQRVEAERDAAQAEASHLRHRAETAERRAVDAERKVTDMDAERRRMLDYMATRPCLLRSAEPPPPGEKRENAPIALYRSPASTGVVLQDGP